MLFDPYAYDLAPPGAGARAARRERQPRARCWRVPEEARALLWRGLREAVEGALDLWEQTPPGDRRVPPSFAVQHAGKPRFDPAHLREQTLAGWHRLLGIELRLAAQALEALIAGRFADHSGHAGRAVRPRGPVVQRTEAPRRG